MCVCDSSGKINQFQSVCKNLWDDKMNVKCAYISGVPFVCIILFYFFYLFCARSEDVRFIHAFCVYNLHFGTSKAMKDHFVFVTLLQSSQCIWNFFDLTWARSEIYHFLEPIRCDSFWEKESKIDTECEGENERIVGLTLALMFLFNQKKTAIWYLLP